MALAFRFAVALGTCSRIAFERKKRNEPLAGRNRHARASTTSQDRPLTPLDATIHDAFDAILDTDVLTEKTAFTDTYVPRPTHHRIGERPLSAHNLTVDPRINRTPPNARFHQLAACLRSRVDGLHVSCTGKKKGNQT